MQQQLNTRKNHQETRGGWDSLCLLYEVTCHSRSSSCCCSSSSSSRTALRRRGLLKPQQELEGMMRGVSPSPSLVFGFRAVCLCCSSSSSSRERRPFAAACCCNRRINKYITKGASSTIQEAPLHDAMIFMTLRGVGGAVSRSSSSSSSSSISTSSSRGGPRVLPVEGVSYNCISIQKSKRYFVYLESLFVMPPTPAAVAGEGCTGCSSSSNSSSSSSSSWQEETVAAAATTAAAKSLCWDSYRISPSMQLLFLLPAAAEAAATAAAAPILGASQCQQQQQRQQSPLCKENLP